MEINENYEMILAKIDELIKSKEENQYSDLHEEIGAKIEHKFLEYMFKDLYSSTDSTALDRLIQERQDFFGEELNNIYLKLVYLYEKIKDQHNEIPEIYYVVDKFTPTNKAMFESLGPSMAKAWLETVIEAGKYEELVETCNNDILNEYREALQYGENKLNVEPNNSENLNKTNDLLKDAIGVFERKEFPVEIVDKDDLDREGAFAFASGLNIPTIYSRLKGSSLTDEERKIFFAELDPVQRDQLAAIISSKTK